jgi:hypothetical protein
LPNFYLFIGHCLNLIAEGGHQPRSNNFF